MENNLKSKRLGEIKSKIEYGDVAKIARTLNVHRNWVSSVLKGDGISERVLKGVEEYLLNRSIRK